MAYKTEIIENCKNILTDEGIGYMDYIVSLQGPTFIFTKEGKKKLTKEIEKRIKELGILIL